MMLWFSLAIVAFVSCLLTALLRRYAIARSLIDQPNMRSSHSIPTPRGGGLAIVISFLAALPVLASLGLLSWHMTWTLFGAGAVVAVLGFMDDHAHVAVRWRLLGHFAAAVWILVWLGGLPPLSLGSWTLSLGWFGHLLALLFLVWLLNLYNFMDGIDALASVQAITSCLSIALIYWVMGHNTLVLTPLLLTAAVAGFLVWNFPPARIFMGDAGSCCLGLVMGALALQAGWVAAELFWAWLILLGVFIVDATWTLLHRLYRGNKVYEAHCTHAYQLATRRYGSHLKVSLAVAVINVVWLLPLALLVAVGVLDGLLGVAVAYAPLLLIAVKLGAGGQTTPA